MAAYYLGDFPRPKTERVKYLLNWMTMAPDLTKKIPLLSEPYDLPNLSTRDLLKAFNRLKKLATDHKEKEMADLNIRLQQGKSANNPKEGVIAQVPDNNETLESNDKQVRNPSTTTTLGDVLVLARTPPTLLPQQRYIKTLKTKATQQKNLA